jgi:DNA-binding response OmpR family regulator
MRAFYRVSVAHARPSPKPCFAAFRERSGGQHRRSAVAKETILIVEDEADIAELLRLYLVAQGYRVRTTAYGQQALEICRNDPPDLLLLDVRLPDSNGHDIGRELRREPRTRDMPIIVLTAWTDRRERIIALSDVRAQYFIGKPFDLEEVATIVRNLLDERARRANMHPVTQLPTAERVNEQLRGLLGKHDWTLALIRINSFETFTQFYGVLVGEEVLNFTALLLRDAVAAHGRPVDFVGQMVVGPYFLVISTPRRLRAVCEHLIANFDAGIERHYAYQDRVQGASDHVPSVRTVPLLSLAVGLLSSDDGPFHDVRDLSEAAERVCQRAVALAEARGRASYIASTH